MTDELLITDGGGNDISGNTWSEALRYVERLSQASQTMIVKQVSQTMIVKQTSQTMIVKQALKQ